MSIEGINGVGKTAAARATAAVLGTRCLLLDELTDQATDPLTGRVIAALGADGDPFLRTGHSRHAGRKQPSWPPSTSP
ncbi:hypothetical protein [Actinomadura rupiterrae]|uniref:hypothetical protein n=1 Tax=Actinomadura rupiterrae TaxID=559627 RepID=UPI0020A37C46|nr:hypothetical protein [Actinomadura rupiterrae]MCP2342959.1 MoxR-like ATPase [Actinomadura rupiterrae]